MSTENLTIEELEKSIHNRDDIMNTLRECGKKLKEKQQVLDGIIIDYDHLAADVGIRSGYKDIIYNIDNLLKFMKSGDWSMSVDSTDTVEDKEMASLLELQDKIYENLRESLDRDYKNAFVALTYDGSIVASGGSSVALLEKLKKLKYKSTQIFIRKVGSASVASWTK